MMRKREPDNFRGLVVGEKWSQLWINWSLDAFFNLLSGPSEISDVFSVKTYMGDLLC